MVPSATGALVGRLDSDTAYDRWRDDYPEEAPEPWINPSMATVCLRYFWVIFKQERTVKSFKRLIRAMSDVTGEKMNSEIDAFDSLLFSLLVICIIFVAFIGASGLAALMLS